VCPYTDRCPACVGGCLMSDHEPTIKCIPYVIGGFETIIMRYKRQLRKVNDYGAEQI